MKYLLTVISVFCLAAAPLSAEAGAYEELSISWSAAGVGPRDQVFVPVPAAVEQREAVQELPPDNDEPGFDWSARGGLCPTAAGRYQFLSKTWAGLASDLGLTDFSPPSQDKACLEIIRREGAYGLVLGSDNFDNFSAALSKLNRIWASLPGSPYGQPTHSRAELWKVYRKAMAR